MSLTFNGTSDWVRLAVGTSTAFQQGTYSFAACVKKRSGSIDATGQAILGANAAIFEWSAGSSPAGGLGIWNGTVQVGTTTELVRAADGWELIGTDKTTGTTTPRGHVYNFTATAQTHHDFSGGNIANSGSSIGGGGVWIVGSDSTTPTEWWDGDIAWVAVWDSAQLTDANYVTMQAGIAAVYGLTPTHLWVMTVAGIVDLMGNGSTESSRNGTTVGSTPPTGHEAMAPLTPVAPTALQYATAAVVSWVAPMDGGSAITGYTLQASLNGGAYSTVYTGNTLTQLITGLVVGGSYTFKVLATNAFGSSSYSPASAAVVPYGTSEIAVFTDGSIQVFTDGTWEAL